MIKSNKSPIIIEFNGLPGTGKSTIVECLDKELKSRGYNVIRRYSHRFWHKYHFTILSAFYNLKLFKLVRSYSSDIVPLVKKLHVGNVVWYVRMYKNIEKYTHADFSLIDQGIIQDLATIAWREPLPCNEKLGKVISEIKKMGIRFVRVDCKNDIELSMDRVVSRTHIGHEFEILSNVELKTALSIQADNFSYIRSVFSQIMQDQIVVEIDTSVLPEENAIKIINTIISQ